MYITFIKKSTLILLVVCICLFSSCDINTPLRNKMIDYYSQNKNYVELVGTIVSISVIASTDECKFEISILDNHHSFPVNSETGYGEFILINYSEQDFKLEVGDEIIFHSAPMYFYNGHYLPIISLEKNEEVLLNLESGKEMYLEWIQETFD